MCWLEMEILAERIKSFYFIFLFIFIENEVDTEFDTKAGIFAVQLKLFRSEFKE